MSTLVVTNISDGTTSVPSSVVTEGGVKSWVLYNHSAASITASLNVSSVTDNSTGLFTMNLTSAHGSANYCFLGALTDSNDAAGNDIVGRRSTHTKTTSAFQAQVTDVAGTVRDGSGQSVALVGELA